MTRIGKDMKATAQIAEFVTEALSWKTLHADISQALGNPKSTLDEIKRLIELVKKLEDDSKADNLIRDTALNNVENLRVQIADLEAELKHRDETLRILRGVVESGDKQFIQQRDKIKDLEEWKADMIKSLKPALDEMEVVDSED